MLQRLAKETFKSSLQLHFVFLLEQLSLKHRRDSQPMCGRESVACTHGIAQDRLKERPDSPNDKKQPFINNDGNGTNKAASQYSLLA